MHLSQLRESLARRHGQRRRPAPGNPVPALRAAGTTGLLIALMLLPASGPSSASASAADLQPVATAGARAPHPPGYVLPVAGPAVVLNRFDAPATRYGRGHRGVDLAAAVGRSVLSAGAGVIVHAGSVAGRGTVSVLHAGGLRTTYEPVTATVHTGDRVRAGQVIGVLGAGHPSCAPVSCLHWGARLPDDSYLDPMSLINGLSVRLLPWSQARG